jgi:transposase
LSRLPHFVLVLFAYRVWKAWDARPILTQRQTMEQNQSASTQTQRAAASGPASQRGTPGFRGYFVGLAQRSALARFTGRVSFGQHLLATFARMGRARCLVRNLARLARATRRPRQAQLERSVFGRQLCSGQKRGLCVGKTKRGKDTKWMVVADGAGIPLGSQLSSASPGEVTLAESTLARIAVPRAGRGRPQSRPLRVIADRAYDSDPLRGRLLQRGIVLICPHRRRRRRPSCNDGRTLRRYTKRWKIERTFAHLGNFRRLLIRHERLLSLYQGFFHLACLMLTRRHF